MHLAFFILFINLLVRGWTPKVASATPRLTKSLFGTPFQRDQAYIQSPNSEELSLHSEGLHLIQKAKPIDLLLLTLPHFGNVLF